MDAVGFNKKNEQLRRKSQALGFLGALLTLIFMSAPAEAVYCYRKAITIQASKVPGNLTNFPVLVSIPANNEMRTVANAGHVKNSNGYDIVFRASDGTTPLAHEVERYIESTGELVAWVKVPVL